MNQSNDAVTTGTSTSTWELVDAADVSERADRPTLLGLAPIESEAGAEGAAEETPRAHVETSTVRPVQLLASDEPAARPPEEEDPEWLDLSTRWLIAPAPPVAQPLVDEDEVTEHVQWADRLAVQTFARGEPLRSSAPPPPQPLAAAPPARRVTMPFGRPAEVPVARPANTARFHTQTAYEPQREWVPRRSSSRYALDERHTGTPTGYTPFYIAKSPRQRGRQPKPSELSLELWNSISDTWLATLIKCALALVLLHYSGLAVPLLALFGYAPTQGPAAARSEAALQPAPAIPVAATLAAPSVIPQRVNPALDEEALSQAPSAPTEVIPRHYRVKPARKQKSSPVAVAAAQPAAPRRASAIEPTPPPASVAPVPLTAAMPESEDAAGEAFLRINSRPWSDVFVDGTHVGHTPKLDLRVRAGTHRIRFVNAELGVSKSIQLRAAAGETVSHVELLEE